MKDKHRKDGIISRMTGKQIVLGAEIGVYKANLSQLLLEELPNLTLHLIDRWIEYAEEEKKEGKSDHHPLLYDPDNNEWDQIYLQAKKTVSLFEDRVVINRLSSVEAAQLYPNGFFDFVFIDADHTYNGASTDIDCWMSKVKPGGYICGHDYSPAWPGVKKAVDEYFSSKQIELDSKTTWFVRVV